MVFAILCVRFDEFKIGRLPKCVPNKKILSFSLASACQGAQRSEGKESFQESFQVWSLHQRRTFCQELLIVSLSFSLLLKAGQNESTKI